MRYQSANISIDYKLLKKTDVREAIIKKLSLKGDRVKNFVITRESLDSRYCNSKGIFRVFSCEFDYDGKVDSKLVRPKEAVKMPPLVFDASNAIEKCVVIGAGPAGLFAALRLLDYGIKPIVIEQGKDMAQRIADVNEFFETGKLDVTSNIQFGLGGAGAFSDGKLNSRIKSTYCPIVLERFVEFGAKKEIVYKAKPHIGTDIIRKVVSSIKDYIVENGGEVFFETRMDKIIIDSGKVTGIITDKGELISCDQIFLGIGNASRKTFEMILDSNIVIEPKPFAVGVRMEHDQKIINKYIYGKSYDDPDLPTAEYTLTYHDDEYDRSVYTFCNCPGGFVINGSSEVGQICVNGMSYSKRNAKNANAAFVVNVSRDDYEDKGPLGGVKFQEMIEKKTYELGGGNYICPSQTIADYTNRDVKTSCEPSIKPQAKYTDISKCFPDFISEPLRHALEYFSDKIDGFDTGVLTACETRTSSPVRITRDKDTLESVSVEGLYPIGEGSGYAGGILSSAVDGFKAVDKMIEKYVKMKEE